MIFLLLGFGTPILESTRLIFSVLLNHLKKVTKSGRGFLLIVPCFILLPDFIGDAGLWLAVPTSEAITLIIILVVKLVEIRRG